MINPWTDQITESMIDHIADGLSFAQTAKALNAEYLTNFTRQAVSGKWGRFIARNYPSETMKRYVRHGNRRVKIELPNFVSSQNIEHTENDNA